MIHKFKLNNFINMNKKDEPKQNLFINNNKIRIYDALSDSEKKKKLPNSKDNLLKEIKLNQSQNQNNEIINIKTNIQNVQNNEFNNSIFIFNKNDDLDKIYNTENNSCLSLIKIMEEKRKDSKKFNKKLKSSSIDKIDKL